MRRKYAMKILLNRKKVEKNKGRMQRKESKNIQHVKMRNKVRTEIRKRKRKEEEIIRREYAEEVDIKEIIEEGMNMKNRMRGWKSEKGKERKEM